MLALVHLGASTTIANWAAAEAAGFARSGDARVETTDDVVAGASGAPVRLSAADATLLVEGDQRPLRLSIVDLPIMAQLGMTGPAMVLGLDALAPRSEEAAGSRVVLQAGEGRVWLEPSAG